MEIDRLDRIAEGFAGTPLSGLLPSKSESRNGPRRGGPAQPNENREIRPFGEAVQVELSSEAKRAADSSNSSSDAATDFELTPEEEEEVRKLRARDAEVRAHENAHKAAAGRYAPGAPSYDFETGPDGKQYAVGGEVSISTSPIAGDPDATIEKMRIVRRAALAPAQPSSQDRKVASQATRTEQSARVEKREMEQAEKQAERSEKSESGGGPRPNPYAKASPKPSQVGQNVNRVA